MKIVLNRCFGGFSVSKAVYDELGIPWDGYGYLENKDFGIDSDNWDDYKLYRADPRLVEAVEKIGLKEASGSLARLDIVDIPDDIEWEIDEYDGQERVAEKHRTW